MEALKQRYVRVKESSLRRRERRLRADARVVSRLLAVAKGTAVHHSQETALVQVVRAYLLSPRPAKGPQHSGGSGGG